MAGSICQQLALYIRGTNVYPLPSLSQRLCPARASQLINPTYEGGVIAPFCNKKLKPREVHWVAKAMRLTSLGSDTTVSVAKGAVPIPRGPHMGLAGTALLLVCKGNERGVAW